MAEDLGSKHYEAELRSLSKLLRSQAPSQKHPVLVAGSIADRLKSLNISFKISRLPSQKPVGRYYTYRSELNFQNSRMTGYATSRDEYGQAKALIEAYERLVVEAIWQQADKQIINNLCLISYPSFIADREEELPVNAALELNPPQNGPLKDGYLAYHFASDQLVILDKRVVVGEKGFYPRTTSGWAVHGDSYWAATNAALELFERHTFLEHWALNVAPEKLEIPRDEFTVELQGDASHFDFQMSLNVFPSDYEVVVVTASLQRAREKQEILLGLAAGFSVEEAAARAIQELMIVWTTQFRTVYDHIGDAGSNFQHLEDVHGLTEYLGRNKSYFSGATMLRRSWQSFLSEFNVFFVTPSHFLDASYLAADVVRAYSPHAIPLFNKEPPKLMPSRFRKAFRDSRKTCPL
jgi:hypothetical protein